MRVVTPELIARVAHAANREWCKQQGLPVRETWDNLDDERRGLVIDGVAALLVDPSITPEQSHERWCEAMRAKGWTYNSVRDEAQKHHECLRPYDRLPAADRAKDYLFRAIVLTLGGFDA